MEVHRIGQASGGRKGNGREGGVRGKGDRPREGGEPRRGPGEVVRAATENRTVPRKKIDLAGRMGSPRNE